MLGLAMPIDSPPRGATPGEGPIVANGRLAIAAVIVAETMLFAGLIGAYLVFRLQESTWPPAGQPRLPVAVTGANSAGLVASALVLRRALAWLRRGVADRAGRAMAWAAALGVAFLVVQGLEWTRLVRHGLTLGSGAYGGVFYLLIGCHAMHVAVAVLWLAGTTAAVLRSWIAPDRIIAVEMCATYWYFVTGLWLVLFPLVYLY